MNAQFLRSIYEDVYGPLDATPGKLKNLDDLAGKLSRIVEHTPPWSARYLNAILCGHKGFSVTKELGTAMQALVDQRDGAHPLRARLIEVSVFSVNGHVQHSSIILGQSKRCKGCQILIVPRVPWQQYCGKECPGRPLKRRYIKEATK